MDEKTTNPLASGGGTTEGKLTIAAVATTLLVSVVTAVAPLFSTAAAANPHIIWLQIAAVAAIALVGGLGLFGYTKGKLTNKGNMVLGVLEKGGEIAATQLLTHFLKRYDKTGEELDAAAARPGTFSAGTAGAPSAHPFVTDTAPTPSAGTPAVIPRP